MEKYIISEAFNKLKQRKRLIESADSYREQLMDEFDSLYTKASRYASDDDIEEILRRNNASEDDNGPEGYFEDMTNKDIENAIKEILQLFPRTTLDLLLVEIVEAINDINDEAIVDCEKISDGIKVKTTTNDFIFKLEPVELANDSIEYTDDDWSDYE